MHCIKQMVLSVSIPCHTLHQCASHKILIDSQIKEMMLVAGTIFLVLCLENFYFATLKQGAAVGVFKMSLPVKLLKK